MNTAPDHLRAAIIVALYLIRFIQLGSVLIAGYAACYLVFMHNHHYCAIRYCGDHGRKAAAVPIGEVMFIISSCLVTIDWMVFAASITFQARMGKQTSTGTAKRLAASCMSLLVYSIGLIAFASIPAVRENWPIAHYIWRNNIYDPPETYFSIVTSNAVSCGLISWIAGLLIVLLDFYEFRQTLGIGGIKLTIAEPTPREEDALSIPDMER